MTELGWSQEGDIVTLRMTYADWCILGMVFARALSASLYDEEHLPFLQLAARLNLDGPWLRPISKPDQV